MSTPYRELRLLMVETCLPGCTLESMALHTISTESGHPVIYDDCRIKISLMTGNTISWRFGKSKCGMTVFTCRVPMFTIERK
jgi:hypothetical protein